MKKLNIGLCGYGFIGKIHTLAYKTMRISTPQAPALPRLVVLCSSSSVDDDFLRNVKEFSALSADKSVDIVDICTPDALHFNQGMDAIRQDKHIYVEKPVAMTLEEIQTMFLAVNRKRVIGQTALVMRFLPPVVAARDLIADGVLGEIINFKVKILNNSYTDPDRPVNWRMSGSLAAGGSLMDTGIHGADLIRFLLGEVEEAQCETFIHYKERFAGPEKNQKVPVTQDEWAFARLTLQSGVKGELETARIAAGLSSRNDVEVFGTEGSLLINLKSIEQPLVFLRRKGRQMKGIMEPRSDFARYLLTIFPSPMFDLGCMVDIHSACAMNMLANVAADRILFPETPTLNEALRSQAIVEMAYLSASEGSRKVHINEILKEVLVNE